MDFVFGTREQYACSLPMHATSLWCQGVFLRSASYAVESQSAVYANQVVCFWVKSATAQGSYHAQNPSYNMLQICVNKIESRLWVKLFPDSVQQMA